MNSKSHYHAHCFSWNFTQHISRLWFSFSELRIVGTQNQKTYNILCYFKCVQITMNVLVWCVVKTANFEFQLNEEEKNSCKIHMLVVLISGRQCAALANERDASILFSGNRKKFRLFFSLVQAEKANSEQR